MASAERKAGEEIEEVVAEEHGLQIDRQRHHDAVDDDGNEIQIKGTLRRMNYDESRRGRFRVWDQEMENVDYYVMAVYEGSPSDPDIVTMRRVETEELAEIIEEEEISWSSAGTTATGNERQAKVSWAAVFPELAEEESELF